MDRRNDPAGRLRTSALVIALVGGALAWPSAVGGQSPSPSAPASTSPSASPAPSAVPGTDPVLAGRFPTELSGDPVAVTTISGDALLALGDVAVPAFVAARDAAIAALALFGKSIADVSVGFATTSDTGASVGLSAIRVAGLDVGTLAPIIPGLVAVRDPDATAETITVGDREVTMVTGSSPADVWYLYVHDDVIWVITADEASLEPILASVP